jgi:hypothetical protein
MDPAKVADKDEWRGLVRDLAAGVSTQAQVANRIWLALMTVSFIVVLPKKDGSLSLPFGLGNIDRSLFYYSLFYPVAFSILVVLAVAFAAAHAQVIRATKHAQKELNSLPAEARDMFDMSCMPSLNRLAPLAQLLQD